MARACAATPWPYPAPHARDWLPRQKWGTALAFHQSLSSRCRRPCWNVAGVTARACPNSRTQASARRASLGARLGAGCLAGKRLLQGPEGHLRLLPPFLPLVAAAPVPQPCLLQVRALYGGANLEPHNQVTQSLEPRVLPGAAPSLEPRCPRTLELGFLFQGFSSLALLTICLDNSLLWGQGCMLRDDWPHPWHCLTGCQ